jgi:protein SCO1
VSIDPRDTASDVKASQGMYSRRFTDPRQAAQGIHFLTGSPAQVKQIAAAVGFPYRFDRASGQFAHPAGFVVLTPTGRISRYFLGLNPDPTTLRQAIAEAGHGTVDPPVHPLLLLCFGYDPDEGTVAALAFRLVRWASIGTIAACALLIGLLSLRRRNA